jgi:ABC-2 type transport system ATP-binding protein
MLTGLSRPTGGNIKICGRDVSFGSLKNRKDIGFLPDVPCFYDWMTPQEFLELSGSLFSIDRAVLKKRIDTLMELVGLSGVKKRIGGFSRGMKQRLGIAQALINEPRVVFLDEPTSALDPIGRKEVMDIIARLSGRVTVFFSTHILSDIERVCDRVIILNSGKVVIEDTIANLREKYSRHCLLLDTGMDGGDGLFSALKEREWLYEIAHGENNELKLYVKDMAKAQYEIPGILHENGLPLIKFTVLEPSLEDIFLKVVNE